MSQMTQDFGVQSFCFRTIKSNADVAQAVKDIGLSKIEVCRIHIDFTDPSVFEQSIADYEDNGVKIHAIGVEPMSGDEAEDRKRFDFLKQCGARHMSVDFNPDTFEQALPVAQKLAEEYDVQLGIHNHGGRHWLGDAQTLAWFFKKAGDRIGLFLDTAWALDSHEDPVAWLDRFGDRMFGVHLKDFVFGRDGKQEDVVVGTGNLDLPGFVRKAREIGFSGATTLEYEGDPDNPVPTLTQCVKAIRETKV